MKRQHFSKQTNAICFSCPNKNTDRWNVISLDNHCTIIVWFRLKDSVKLIQITCIDCPVKLSSAHQWKSHAQCGPNVIWHRRHWASWPNCTLGNKEWFSWSVNGTSVRKLTTLTSALIFGLMVAENFAYLRCHTSLYLSAALLAGTAHVHMRCTFDRVSSLRLHNL